MKLGIVPTLIFLVSLNSLAAAPRPIILWVVYGGNAWQKFAKARLGVDHFPAIDKNADVRIVTTDNPYGDLRNQLDKILEPGELVSALYLELGMPISVNEEGNCPGISFQMDTTIPCIPLVQGNRNDLASALSAYNPFRQVRGKLAPGAEVVVHLESHPRRYPVTERLAEYFSRMLGLQNGRLTISQDRLPVKGQVLLRVPLRVFFAGASFFTFYARSLRGCYSTLAAAALDSLISIIPQSATKFRVVDGELIDAGT